MFADNTFAASTTATLRWALVLAGGGALVAAGLLQTGAATAHADSCPDVEVVFARGTGEPAGLGVVGEAFVNALRNAAPKDRITAYAVNYPASYDFLQATSGADDASAHVQTLAAACSATKIVLGGYSQGAAVVDLMTSAANPLFGFTDPMPADVAGHVAAVAVFGNPSAKLGRPLTTLSSLYGAKSIDLCNGADPVCSDGSDRPAHSQYVQAGLPSQAADFVAQRLTGGGNSANV